MVNVLYKIENCYKIANDAAYRNTSSLVVESIRKMQLLVFHSFDSIAYNDSEFKQRVTGLEPGIN